MKIYKLFITLLASCLFYSCVSEELIKNKDTDDPNHVNPPVEEIDDDTDDEQEPSPDEEEEKPDNTEWWKKPEYQKANTALNEEYLSQEEKDVFYFLNLVRLNPSLFAETFVAGYNGDEGWQKGYAFDERKQSLMEELSKTEPMGLLYPDVDIYQYAHCFAYEGGRLGLTGHDRTQTGCTKSNKYAECCKYGGARKGLSIILSFLIDPGENNAALGHRKICLDKNYVKMGVSIEDHINYRFGAVLNFARQ